MDYSSDIFDEFMNLINITDEDNKLLLKCYIIAQFIPEITKAYLNASWQTSECKIYTPRN
jgi:hypothetical protein